MQWPESKVLTKDGVNEMKNNQKVIEKATAPYFR